MAAFGSVALVGSVTRAWRELPPPHRRWIVVNALLATGVINLVTNGLGAAATAAGQQSIPRWASPLPSNPSVLTDTIGTFFVLPLVTNLLVTLAVVRDIRSGRLPRPGAATRLDALVDRLPARPLRRGLVLGVATTVVCTPPLVLVLATAGAADMSLGGFVLYNAVLGVVLGAVVTPFVAVGAMLRPPPVDVGRR